MEGQRPGLPVAPPNLKLFSIISRDLEIQQQRTSCPDTVKGQEMSGVICGWSLEAVKGSGTHQPEDVVCRGLAPG